MTIECMQVDFCNTISFLTVISEICSRQNNIFEITKKASSAANVILHAFNSHDINLCMRAFDAYVKPILEYCSCVWN